MSLDGCSSPEEYCSVASLESGSAYRSDDGTGSSVSRRSSVESQPFTSTTSQADEGSLHEDDKAAIESDVERKAMSQTSQQSSPIASTKSLRSSRSSSSSGTQAGYWCDLCVNRPMKELLQCLPCCRRGPGSYDICFTCVGRGSWCRNTLHKMR